MVRTKRPQWQPLAWRSGASSGTVTVDDRGQTHFAEGPGKHRYLILDAAQKARTLETMILLASQNR